MFALGSIMIKSCYLGTRDAGSESSRYYSITDKNEAAAIQLVPNTIPVTRILFSGKISSFRKPEIYKMLIVLYIKGKYVIIQQRIPSVGLNGAWPYLSPTQKSSFKEQTLKIIDERSTVQPLSTEVEPTYLVSDPNPRTNRNISSSESEILFGNRLDRGAKQLKFVHNDLQPSDTIVENDVGAVHSQFLMPKREDFAGVQLPEEKMDDLEYLGDLYAFASSYSSMCYE